MKNLKSNLAIKNAPTPKDFRGGGESNESD